MDGTLNARPLPCMHCGEAVVPAAAESIRCPGCGVTLAVVDDAPATIGLLPRLDADAARAAFARVFAADEEPAHGPPETRAELFFAPFVQLSGTMVGVAADGRAVHRWVQAEIAACQDRDELGIDEVDLTHLDDADGLPSADTAALRRLGSVLYAERERDEIEAFLADQVRMPADGDEPVVVGRRLTQIHYPIWRLRWHVRGRLYQAAIDGMTGTLLHARVPARQRRRAFQGVFAAACGGYVLGTMLRRPVLGLPDLARSILRADPFTLLPTFSLVLLGLALYALLINAALNSLRYRNELEYHSGLKTRILINRPAETLLDRGTAAIKTGWNWFFSPRRYDR